MVHFDVRFDPRFQTVAPVDVSNVLIQEFEGNSSKYLTNLTIDPTSLEVQPSLSRLNVQEALQTTVSTLPTTTTALPPRKCTKLEFSYCRHISYNVTTYPNVLGHKSLKEVEQEAISFR